MERNRNRWELHRESADKECDLLAWHTFAPMSSPITTVRGDDELMPGIETVINEVAPELYQQMLTIVALVAIKAQPAPILTALVRDNPVTFASIEEKLEALEEEWREHNSGKSFIEFNHFAYYQIMGIGPAAIPLLLKRIEQGSNAWFVALKAIAGVAASGPANKGNPKAARAAWLEWGQNHGYAATPAIGAHAHLPLLPPGAPESESGWRRLE